MNILESAGQIVALFSDVRMALLLIFAALIALVVMFYIYGKLKDAWWHLAGEKLAYTAKIKREEMQRGRRKARYAQQAKFREWDSRNSHYRAKYRRRYGG